MISYIKNKALRKRLNEYYEGVAKCWKNKDDKLEKYASDKTMHYTTKRIVKDGLFLLNTEKFIKFKIKSSQSFDPTKIMFLNTNSGKIEKVFPLEEEIKARFFISDIMVNNIIDKMMEDRTDDIVIGICNNIVKIAIMSESEKSEDIIKILKKMPTFKSMCCVSHKKCSYFISEHVIDNSKVQWFERAMFYSFTKAISEYDDYTTFDNKKLKLSSIYGIFGKR